jgi:hypothetical protein
MEYRSRERLEYLMGKALQWFGAFVCLAWLLFIGFSQSR